MSQSITAFGQYIVEARKQLSEMAISLEISNSSSHIEHLSNHNFQYLDEEAIDKIGHDFIAFIGEALRQRDKEKFMEKAGAWGRRLGEMAVKEQIPMEMTIKRTRFYREAIFLLIEEKAEEFKLSINEILLTVKIINGLLDQCSYSLSLEYIKKNQQEMEWAKQSIRNLSAPIILLKQKIGVLPIVSEVDNHRSQVIMEKALRQSTNLQLDYLIMDLSGITVMDANVAQNLYQVIKALQLLGVETMITGIRPEVSQTMVALDISFSSLTVLGSLQQALNSLGVFN